MGDYADFTVDREYESYLDSLYDPYEFESQNEGSSRKGEVYFNRKYNSIIRETNKAWLILMEQGREIWFPKSLCVVDYDKKEISIPSWMMINRKLI